MRYAFLAAAFALLPVAAFAACPSDYSPEMAFARGNSLVVLVNAGELESALAFGEKGKGVSDTCPIRWVEPDMSFGVVTCNGTDLDLVFDNGAVEFAGKIYQRQCP